MNASIKKIVFLTFFLITFAKLNTKIRRSLVKLSLIIPRSLNYDVSRCFKKSDLLLKRLCLNSSSFSPWLSENRPFILSANTEHMYSTQFRLKISFSSSYLLHANLACFYNLSVELVQYYCIIVINTHTSSQAFAC